MRMINPRNSSMRVLAASPCVLFPPCLMLLSCSRSAAVVGAQPESLFCSGLGSLYNTSEEGARRKKLSAVGCHIQRTIGLSACCPVRPRRILTTPSSDVSGLGKMEKKWSK